MLYETITNRGLVTSKEIITYHFIWGRLYCGRFLRSDGTFTPITADNGNEYTRHKLITKLLKANVYFTDPYFLWQKSNIEHTNELMCQYMKLP